MWIGTVAKVGRGNLEGKVLEVENTQCQTLEYRQLNWKVWESSLGDFEEHIRDGFLLF
jgi:hypothetical protein